MQNKETFRLTWGVGSQSFVSKKYLQIKKVKTVFIVDKKQTFTSSLTQFWHFSLKFKFKPYELKTVISYFSCCQLQFQLFVYRLPFLFSKPNAGTPPLPSPLLACLWFGETLKNVFWRRDAFSRHSKLRVLPNPSPKPFLKKNELLFWEIAFLKKKKLP